MTQLDIKELYTLITEDISENAITFAKTFISINDSDLRIVKHCRKSLLFSKEEDWKRTFSLCCRDVTMGSYGSTEMVSTAKKRAKQGTIHIIRIFKKIGFQIDIMAILKEGKPNDKLLYVHTSSKHPSQIIRQLPNAINERLCHNSSNETVFNSTKFEYEVL